MANLFVCSKKEKKRTQVTAEPLPIAVLDRVADCWGKLSPPFLGIRFWSIVAYLDLYKQTKGPSYLSGGLKHATKRRSRPFLPSRLEED